MASSTGLLFDDRLRKGRHCAKRGACEICGKLYLARLHHSGRFCSHDCHRVYAKAHPISTSEKMIHQSDDAALKIRANGLINSRLRRGLIVRPECCELCGTKGKVDACHVDYSKPHVVVWACRSCHMRSHWDPTLDREMHDAAKPRGDAPKLSRQNHKVYSLDDGRVWDSVAQCSRDLGITSAAILKSLRRGHRAAGLRLSRSPQDDQSRFSPTLQRLGRKAGR